MREPSFTGAKMGLRLASVVDQTEKKQGLPGDPKPSAGAIGDRIRIDENLTHLADAAALVQDGHP